MHSEQSGLKNELKLYFQLYARQQCFLKGCKALKYLYMAIDFFKV